MKIRSIPHFAFLAATLGSAPLASAAIIVSESFGGDGTNPLNSTKADFFSGAITTAGGSDTWVAASIFDDSGTVTVAATTQSPGSAYLSLGSYINDHKGASDGKFIAKATLDADGLTSWYGLSFFVNSTFSTADTFTSQGSGTIIHRSEESGDVVDAFGGTNTDLGVDGGTTVYTTGATLTIILDLTAAGGYNGTDNFGDIEFQVNGSTIGTKQEFTTDRTFGSIGLTAIGGSQPVLNNAYATSFQLEQIPEPSAALLGGLGALLLLCRRR